MATEAFAGLKGDGVLAMSVGVEGVLRDFDRG